MSEIAARRPGALSRRWHTLRYYRTRQIVRRVASVIRRRVQSGLPVDRFAASNLAITDVSLGDTFERIVRRKLDQRRSDPRLRQRVAASLCGRWTLLGRTYELGSPVDWRSPQLESASRLWQFQLQYHEWLLDLAAATALEERAACPSASAERSPGPAADIWTHVAHWIETYQRQSERDAGDAWHPYCISRRIPAWLSLWAWQAPPEDLRRVIAHSLGAQAAFLARRVETDLGGNHLLENARALVLAGAACRNRDGERWLSRGERLIERELLEQVLPHGEHFERSPMYHCQMIDVLQDVRDAAAPLRPGLARTCGEALERMQRFAAAITSPDGRIPLLGDACFDEAPAPECVSGNGAPGDGGLDVTAEGPRQTGEYWTFRSEGDFLLFDSGPVGPDHLPAHAHADLLTIEASFDRQRVIVDSGTYDYDDGEMRQYCRSTAAHNVLELDGENQCDVWSRFRVGRRGWPSPLQCGADEDLAWASATHNAYRHLGVHTVGRWIGCAHDSWLIVDWALGRGLHRLVNRLHLHPDVTLARVSSATLLLQRGGTTRFLSALGVGELVETEGWYCPRFGVRRRNPVIEFRTVSSLPRAVGWQLSRSRPPDLSELATRGDQLTVRWSDAAGDRRLNIPTRLTEP